jgi:L-lactate dehydrogenase complex protein LldF
VAAVVDFKDALYSHYLNSSASASSYYKSHSAYETVKRRASFYRYKVLHDERKYLIEFEKNFSLSGGKALYAETPADALAEIAKILESEKGGKQTVLLDKSDIIDEIGIETFLAKQNKPFIDANIYKHNDPFIPENYSALREKIIAATGGNAEDYAYPEDIYKQYLRQNSYKRSVAISAADFLVADTGGIVIRDNAGCSVFSLLLCRTKIFIAGIDRILASLADLSLYSRLYATLAYNRPLSLNQTIFSGRSNVYLIFVDNGRTEILSDPERRSVLACINCGACNGVCPTGNPVSFVRTGNCNCCTLCGLCQDVCPVNIPLKELILKSRKAASSGVKGVSDTATGSGTSVSVIDKSRIKILTKMFLKRKSMEKGTDRFFLKRAFKKAFGSGKIFPNFDRKTFNQIWMKQHPINEDD